MLIHLGNAAPKHAVEPASDAPRVSYVHIPDTFADAHGNLHYDFNPKADMGAFRAHLVAAFDPFLPADRQGVTRCADLGYGNQEALLSLLHPSGAWAQHSTADPLWVGSVDGAHDAFTKKIADHFGVSHGIPKNVQDTHFTNFGHRVLPPGVHPNTVSPRAALQNAGRLLQSNMMGGGQVGAVGQASASSATTLTTGSTYTTNQWAGYRVYATTSATNVVWGNIISNTNAASASVLTVDRWYAAATPGGAAGTTASATATFIIADGGSTSAWFVGLSASSAGAASATSLSGEITTGGGGLIRKIAPYANTSSVSPVTWTLTPVFTANGTDTLPVTITSMGGFTSMVAADVTDTSMNQTNLNATATLSASGDQLTITDTWTGS